MKSFVAFFLLLASCGVLLGDTSNAPPSLHKPARLLEDLARLTKAGSSEATVLAYAKAHRLELPPELSDNDLRWLRDSGVSEAVVRYMTAIDVRASDEVAQEDVASGSREVGGHSRAAYSNSGSDDDSNRDSDPDTYADRYVDNYADNYADSDSDACAADYDGYPCYDYGYYSYPLYFYADHRGFFARFPRRDHRFGGRRGFEAGREVWRQRGGIEAHFASRDAWRERGVSGRRGGSVVVHPRGSGRPALARGSRSLPGRAIGHRGFGASGSARGSFPNGFRGPHGSTGFSGGLHTGGASTRGSHGASGSPGGRARR